MRGILISTTGGPEVLKYKTDLPVPTPKAGEVLIKNAFVGINFIDTYSTLSLSLLTYLKLMPDLAISAAVFILPLNPRFSAAMAKGPSSLPVLASFTA